MLSDSNPKIDSSRYASVWSVITWDLQRKSELVSRLGWRVAGEGMTVRNIYSKGLLQNSAVLKNKSDFLSTGN